MSIVKIVRLTFSRSWNSAALPKVEIDFNADGRVVSLRVLSRFEDMPLVEENMEFFGPLALIDEGKIILEGPRFEVTERTRFLDQNNKPGSLDDAPLGQGERYARTASSWKRFL